MSLPFVETFFFHYNLIDLEIKDIKWSMASLSYVQLFPFVPDTKAKYFLLLKIILSFFFLSPCPIYHNSVSFHIVEFLWKPIASVKAEVFAQLMTYKKVNANDMP